MNILDTGIKKVKNVAHFIVGEGSLGELTSIINFHTNQGASSSLILIDRDFRDKNLDKVKNMDILNNNFVFPIKLESELTTDFVDNLVARIRAELPQPVSIVVGIGGGSVMDLAKAISNLLNNPGSARNYQGWDLVKNRGVYKVGVPTLSGTGAEATRTCVLTNPATGLKLGMNSDYTVFDFVLLDPSLSETVPRDQFFWSGMDAYIHCIEALAGRYRNPIGDAYSRETTRLCLEVFNSEDMMSLESREKMMVASYLGGSAIATSYVGVVHPFSAGLSVVLGIPHCLANCIVMRAMDEFYPTEYEKFWMMVEKQKVHIPKGICKNLSEEEYCQLHQSTIIHEKPLYNALGSSFREYLSMDKVTEIFLKM